MIGNLVEGIAPKTAIGGLVLWGAANYLVIGVEIGGRVIRADHLPACRAGFSDTIKRHAEQTLRSIPTPKIDTGREMAAARVRDMMNSPAGQMFMQGPFSAYGQNVTGALQAFEHEKAELQAAYRRAVDQVNAATAVKIGRADDYCTCIGERVIESSRTELAVWTGTLGMVRSAKLNFSVAMAQQSAAGACSGYGAS